MARPLAGKRLLLLVEDAPLAELLAASASSLGAEVQLHATGRGALEALQAPRPPDAAVLDLPVADLRGGEVIGALRAAGVPVIAISGSLRGTQAAGEVLRLGAADFFEKPFPAQALLARAARLMGAALPALGPPEDAVTGAFPLGPAGQPGQPVTEEPFLALALDERPGPAPGAPPPWLSAPWPGTGPEPPRAAPQGPQGDLARIRLPRLLVALHQSQATGALTVTRGQVKKLIVMEKGAPVYAASNMGAERFGAICVRRRLVSAEALEGLRRQAPGERAGDLLERAGHLERQKRLELVGAQVRAIAWSMFEWAEGRYQFQLARPPTGLLPLRLSMADLLLEGMVRASTLPRLVVDLPAGIRLAPAQDPAFELYALGLRPGEAHLLSLCDGTRSVLDLVALSRLPERESLAFLQALRVMRVLDDVERILAGSARSAFM